MLNGQISQMMGKALAPTRNRAPGRPASGNAVWTMEEDMRLSALVENVKSVSWCSLAVHFPGKTAQQIAGRWEKVLNPRLVKGSWKREEDEVILEFVAKNGDKDWAKLASMLNGRTGKQCRERFKNHLDPTLSKDPWTSDEDDRLISLHEQFGNSWTKLSAFFPGRTDNCIKNRWNSTIRKRLERIEKGEPLVMKRGRKPRPAVNQIVPKPDLSGPLDHDVDPDCSSPIMGAASPRAMIELLPLCGKHYNLLAPQLCAPKRQTVTSVKENRDGLQKLLSEQI